MALVLSLPLIKKSNQLKDLHFYFNRRQDYYKMHSQ
jgi:hypothetical protein